MGGHGSMGSTPTTLGWSHSGFLARLNPCGKPRPSPPIDGQLIAPHRRALGAVRSGYRTLAQYCLLSGPRAGVRRGQPSASACDRAPGGAPGRPAAFTSQSAHGRRSGGRAGDASGPSPDSPCVLRAARPHARIPGRERGVRRADRRHAGAYRRQDASR